MFQNRLNSTHSPSKSDPDTFGMNCADKQLWFCFENQARSHLCQKQTNEEGKPPDKH